MNSFQTLTEALDDACTRWSERDALSSAGANLTYGEVRRKAQALASGYARFGVRLGDRVVCRLSNCPENIIAAYGAWTRGAIHAGVDRQLTPAEFRLLASLVKPSAILYELRPNDSMNSLHEIREHFPNALILVKSSATLPKGFLNLSAFLEQAPDPGLALEKTSREDPAIIFFTSGTTGEAKAATGGHENLQRRWLRLASRLAFGPEDVHLTHLPLAHGFGLMMAMSGLLTGGRLVLLDGFSREQVMATMREQTITVLNGAPVHFQLLERWLSPERFELRGVRFGIGSSAAFPLPLLQNILNLWGIEFMLMYGSSEGVGVVTTDREDILCGSVGRPTTNSVAILDRRGQSVLNGKVGEIAFSRRAFPVKYWNAPSSVVETEWYHSGDLGRIDQAGRLFVLGRLDHQINRGGLKIDPTEVEKAALTCPDVSEVSVLGIPDPIMGERIFAFVVPVDGHTLTLDTFRRSLSGRLATFKLPDGLRVLDQIPRTERGKPDLDKLRCEAAKMTRGGL